MNRSPRSPNRLAMDASDSFIEERGKTFLVPRRPDSSDGASSSASFASDIDTQLPMVNNKSDRKESQIMAEMREDFERRLERDKRHQEEVIVTLKRELSALTKMSYEYDSLKDHQKTLKHEIGNQQEKITSLKEENVRIKGESAKVQNLMTEIDGLKSENESLRKDKAFLELRTEKLKTVIVEKEHELASMKILMDNQYKRIKLDLTNTKDKFYTEQETLHKGMRKQNLMLSEISEAVRSLAGTSFGGQPVNNPRRERPTGGTHDYVTKSFSSNNLKSKPGPAPGRTVTSTSLEKITVPKPAQSKRKTLGDQLIKK
ncbi:hypothetical protein MAR_012095 [Mya arenaria]|uniref:Uncharacterized protein n=1 Tax=Mya arenaria TaxID=6604 RepID=A0ABY7G059_MYAAR|nr:uncharacterized protein LOC128218541 [Mya arenaria]WAR26391.1 hypothetical protein MAR_012095 [Mya arenaria]